MKKTESTVKTNRDRVISVLYIFQRLAILLVAALTFLPSINPAKVSGLLPQNRSLFANAMSYSKLVEKCQLAFRLNYIEESVFYILYVGCVVAVLGLILLCAGGCMSVGNRKLQKIGNWFTLGGSLVEIAGIAIIYASYLNMETCAVPDGVEPVLAKGIYVFTLLAALILVLTVVLQLLTMKKECEEKCEIESKYKLFLMMLPFIALAFVFSYLPLWGWRYAFFDYQSGDVLSMDKFVGTKWFTYLFENKATRRDIARVMKNTLAMSGLGIATSWVAMAFAIFLSEIKSAWFKRFVQVFTTIPNFISWVLVYAIAFAIFSTDGFINSMTGGDVDYLASTSHLWLKMLAWGMWKGLGWSAIIYIAGISGIDQQLYEAATVDGAGRFQKMLHITVPGLSSTFFVLLLMSIAGILSNGMDQYLVFSNAMTKQPLEVLDLYVYNIGIGSSDAIIPLSTVVSMSKSIVSVILLFGANGISKLLRGESIM
ncbi:MAG: sugar ABC transporter permease [Lachnospiraceae bacterium]|nr:sugar ABC transporter permease [Lachnospiraceae bacterium]